MGQIGRPGNSSSSGILVAGEYYHLQRSYALNQVQCPLLFALGFQLQKGNFWLVQYAAFVEGRKLYNFTLYTVHCTLYSAAQICRQ